MRSRRGRISKAHQPRKQKHREYGNTFRSFSSKISKQNKKIGQAHNKEFSHQKKKDNAATILE
jgi:hypothetical protein